MHWIINEGLKSEASFPILMGHLNTLSIPYTLVRKPPRVGYLIAMHDDLDENGNHRPIMLDPIEGPVFVLGTASMKEVSRAHGWAPGYIDSPAQEECLAAWGEHMLNASAHFGPLKSIALPEGETFFIRPDQARKAFTGRVLKKEDFDAWRRDLIGDDTRPLVTSETKIMIAPAMPIWSEYRCIVVEGNYVTGSRYKTGNIWAQSPDVGNRIIQFVEERAAEWMPQTALCIDVGDTPNGLKIIETNAISSAGFYSNDMRRFVDAIERMSCNA